jgi:hypothetical protein
MGGIYDVFCRDGVKTGRAVRKLIGMDTEINREREYGDLMGRAIAEAVSRRLPTAAAWVRARVGQVGFVVDKVASGQVFSE